MTFDIKRHIPNVRLTPPTSSDAAKHRGVDGRYALRISITHHLFYRSHLRLSISPTSRCIEASKTLDVLERRVLQVWVLAVSLTFNVALSKCNELTSSSRHGISKRIDDVSTAPRMSVMLYNDGTFVISRVPCL